MSAAAADNHVPRRAPWTPCLIRALSLVWIGAWIGILCTDPEWVGIKILAVASSNIMLIDRVTTCFWELDEYAIRDRQRRLVILWVGLSGIFTYGSERTAGAFLREAFFPAIAAANRLLVTGLSLFYAHRASYCSDHRLQSYLHSLFAATLPMMF